MAVSVAALRDALTDVVGAEHLTDDGATLAAHAVAGVTPRWVARPAGPDEVSRLLALATAERLAVAPRGSGSSLDLGAPPRRLDLVIDARRLAAVLDYVAEDMVASVGAGLSLGALAQRLAPARQRWPLDPLAGTARSVGGVLATNASGPLRFRHGTGRDLLLGVRFVQADGTVTWGGARVVKSVTGYDVPKLLVGSLGTLGIIVEATLRLHPIPPVEASWLCPFPTAEVAGAFLSDLLDTTLEPARVVLLNAGALRALGAPRMAVAVALSIESVAEAVASQGAEAGRLAARHGSAAGPAPAALWSGLGGALDGVVRLRLAAPLPRLAFWLAEVERRASALGLGVAGAGEAGSGVLWLGLTGSPAAATLDAGLLRPLREGLAAEDGSLVVDRVPVSIAGALDVWGPVAPEALAIMERVKRQFDPLGLLNPGRFVGGL